jgi:hypothetical protein
MNAMLEPPVLREAGLPAPPTRPAALSRTVWARYTAAALVVAGVTAGCMWTAARVTAPPPVHAFALFIHLAALITGFGAVLAVDWTALLWLVRRRSMSQVLDTAASVAIPIWVGYAGLVGTGMLLHPDPSAPWTRVTLALVVVIGVNGIAAALVHHAMLHRPLPATVAGAVCATVSQGAWWSATAIGFVNAH